MTFYGLKLSHPAYTEFPGTLAPLHVSLYLQVSYKSTGKEREEDKYPGVYWHNDYWGSGWKNCTHHPITAIPESKQSFRLKKKTHK